MNISAPDGSNYEMLEVLKENGKFNTVLRVREHTSGTLYVLKKLRPGLREAHTQRLLREVEHNCEHPNLIQTLGTFEEAGNTYIIREFVEGSTARQRLQRHKLSLKETIHITLQVLDALAALHEKQIIHADIRPDNILLSESDIHGITARLFDLGLSRKLGEPIQQLPFSMLYAAPEQVLQMHELVNCTTDLYSMGIVLYELLTGKKPFEHTHPELLKHLQLNQPLAPAPRHIPEPLFQILQKATHKPRLSKPPRYYTRNELAEKITASQEHRYQTAAAMKQALLNIEIKPTKRFRFF